MGWILGLAESYRSWVKEFSTKSKRLKVIDMTASNAPPHDFAPAWLTHDRGKADRYRFIRWIVGILLYLTVSACNGLPDLVERKDGYSWIPIADTAFLIQDKAWLKGYSRNSTDGLVDSFHLHAMARTMEPWSPENKQAMYLPMGFRGAAVDIDIRIVHYPNFIARFRQFPQSRWGGHALVEEPSEFASVGLRKLKQLPYIIQEGINKGKEVRDKVVFFENLEENQVKYFIRCDDEPKGYNKSGNLCYLSFPYGKYLEVGLTYWRSYLPDSVSMADKITEKLNEFEMAGRTRLVEKNTEPAK